MGTTRRAFLRTSSAGLAAVMVRGPALLGAATESQRRKLAHRRRRIIFNDDGDDVWHPQAKTPEGFVGVRLKHMLDTQVDTLFYSTTQSFNFYTHRTKVGEVFLSREGPFAHNNMQALIDAGTDPLALSVEYAHTHGIEAVWSLRMNDIHDAFTAPLYPKWKRDHPDALFGTRADLDRHPPGGQRRWWSGVDFEREDVRRRTVELIAEVAREYDVDAIDLDWLRHPIHFRTTWAGKPTTPEQRAVLTRLVRRIRRTLDEIGARRGRPILLGARVPMTVKHGLYMGTDVEAWLKEGLVDLLTIGGGYVPFSMPTAELVALGHKHDVPVYPCVSGSGMTRRKPYGPGSVYGAAAWRAAAANAYHAKADGVSLFNLFPSPGDEAHNELVRHVFSQAGDPATLKGKDKLFCLDNADHMKRCGYINHVVPYQDCLPKSVGAGKPLTVALLVGDDVSGAKACVLRVQTDKPAPLSCRLNGHRLALVPSAELAKRFGMTWSTATVDRAVLKQGPSRFNAEMAQASAALTGLELSVDY